MSGPRQTPPDACGALRMSTNSGGAGPGSGGGWLAAWECVVCVVFVGLSAAGPLWRRGRPAAAAADPAAAKRAYIFAGGSVSTLAMILSVSRGTLGVRSFLGFPSELVYFGAAMWETLYGLVLAFPLVCWLFVPVYFQLQTNSVYEYLQMRFGSRWVRRVAAGTFLARQTLNLAVTVYTPAVALHAALAVPHWAAAAALAAAAAAFTLLGGLAAAIRADVIQTLAMVGVSSAFIWQATAAAGGVRLVAAAGAAGGRLRVPHVAWDPTVRVDTLSALVGQLFMSASVYGCQQTFVQRYCALGSAARVRRTLLAAAPAVALLFSLAWLVGLALYALYRRCDPLAAGAIAAPDEVLAYYVRDQFAFLPGMMGLFLGSLFNGALSFVVSNVNSLATVTWEDFVSAAPAFRGVSERQQLALIKTIGVLYAVGISGLSLCVGSVGGVVEGSQLVTAATSGALLGVFVLGALVPACGARGALAGMLAAHALTATLAAGRLAYVTQDKAMLPLDTSGCSNATLAALAARTAARAQARLAGNRTLALGPLLVASAPRQHHQSAFTRALVWVFSISYMWYAVIGTAVCVAVGTIVGACVDRGSCDPRLLHPAVARLTGRQPEAREPDVAAPDSKDASERTDDTPADEPAPAPLAQVTANRVFDAYETKPRAQRTRL